MWPKFPNIHLTFEEKTPPRTSLGLLHETIMLQFKYSHGQCDKILPSEHDIYLVPTSSSNTRS